MTMRTRTLALGAIVAAAVVAGAIALRPGHEAAPPPPAPATPPVAVVPAPAESTPQAEQASPTEERAGAAVRRSAETPAPAPAPRPTGQRPSLLPLVQPLWSELTPGQQFLLAPFEDQWNSWPLSEKRVWIQLADRFPRLSPEQQARAQERVQEWAALSPEQRRLARQNYRLAKKLPADERVAQWQQYDTLTPEQKEVLRDAGSTSNTAARHAGARTALAKEAAKPIVQNP